MPACLLLCLVFIATNLFAQAPTKESFTYGVEWRLIRAGITKISLTPLTGGWQGDIHLESSGLVSKLYKVEDNYAVTIDDQLCARNTVMKAIEGKRERETKVNYDRQRGKATYLERDLLKNSTVLSKEIDTPNCVVEWLSGLYKMRTLKLEPGQSATIPMSDGKRFSNVKVEAQEREEVTTPLGKFKTMRYEVYVFDGALINRKARA